VNRYGRDVIDFERRRIRSKIEAALLDAGDDDRSPVNRFKAEAIARLSGRVVELGPGTGVNLRHYSPEVELIAVEPNPVMRERLTAANRALERPVELDVRDLRGESIALDDGWADAVVATLLLCGADDPEQVIHEARRVLRPGGQLVFVEHVAAPPGTTTARLQRALRRPHHWMFNGCRTDHDAEALLRSFEWSSFDVENIDLGSRAVYVRHQIVGTAVR